MKNLLWSVVATAAVVLWTLQGYTLAAPQSPGNDGAPTALAGVAVSHAVYRPDSAAEIQLARWPHGHWHGYYGRPYRSYYYGGYYPYYSYSYPYPYYSYSYPNYGSYGYGYYPYVTVRPYPYVTARPYWRHGGVGVWW